MIAILPFTITTKRSNMNKLNKARQTLSTSVDAMYDALLELIKNNGGFVDTQNCNGKRDTIFSIDCSDDTYECDILALRVKNNEIQYVSEYGYCCQYTREEIEDMDWTNLRGGNNYYVQTLINICDRIDEYVTEEN